MFYNDKTNLETALMLMLNNTDSVSLMQNMNACFSAIDTSNIIDVSVRKLAELVKTISNDIHEKNISSPEAARSYISMSSLPDNIKKLILEMKTRFSEEAIDSYNKFYVQATGVDKMSKAMDKLNEAVDKWKKSGIENISKYTADILNASSSFNDIIDEVIKNTSTDDAFVISNNTSFGIDRLESNIKKKDQDRIRTGMWIDNLNGGGFKAGDLYIVAAIAGGFKSGFLQNVAEFVSLGEPEQFKLPTGIKPLIYYLNLEMSGAQMLSRKLSFYGENMDDIIMNLEHSTDTSLEKELEKILSKHGSKIPIWYEQVKPGLTANELSSKLKDVERLGYKVVCCMVDYIDEMGYNLKVYDEQEKTQPLVLKAKALRQIAKDFQIPVISAAQLNRDIEKELKSNEHRAPYEDIVLRANSGGLSKAYALKAIPEQIYIVYKVTINDTSYISIVVDKDRDNSGKFVPIQEKNIEPVQVSGVNSKPSKFNARVLYVAPLIHNSIRISNDYRDSITKFKINSVDSILNDMEVTSLEVDPYEDNS